MIPSTKRWHVRGWCCAGALVVGCAISGPAFAQRPGVDARLESVFKDWKYRQSLLKSAKYVLTGSTEFKETDTKLPPGSPIRPRRAVILLDLVKKRYWMEQTEEVTNVIDGDAKNGLVYKTCVSTSTWDGELLQKLMHRKANQLPADGPDLGIGKGNLGPGAQFGSEMWPIFMAHGIVPTVHSPLMVDKWPLIHDSDDFDVAGLQLLRGQNCLIVRTDHSPGSSPISDEFWINPNQKSAIHRQVYFSGANPWYVIDIFWKKTDFGWWVDRWSDTWSLNGRVQRVSRFGVESFEANPAVSDSDFKLPAEPGMKVMVSEGPPLGKGLDPFKVAITKYVISPSGTWEEISATGFTTREGKELPPESRRGWIAWTIGGALAIALCFSLCCSVGGKNWQRRSGLPAKALEPFQPLDRRTAMKTKETLVLALIGATLCSFFFGLGQKEASAAPIQNCVQSCCGDVYAWWTGAPNGGPSCSSAQVLNSTFPFQPGDNTSQAIPNIYAANQFNAGCKLKPFGAYDQWTWPNSTKECQNPDGTFPQPQRVTPGGNPTKVGTGGGRTGMCVATSCNLTATCSFAQEPCSRDNPMKPAPLHRGMTLIELLVVISILAVLIALLLPAVQRVRLTSERLRCQNNLRQIGIALHLYNDALHTLPPGVRAAGSDYPFMSWLTRILPYIEQEAVWKQAVAAYAADNDWRDDPPHPFAHPMQLYGCPSDPRSYQIGFVGGRHRIGFTSYLGVEGRNQTRKDGCLFLNSSVQLTDISDGTSCTLLVGERPPSADKVFGWWYAGWGQSQDGSADMVLGVRERNVRLINDCPFRTAVYGPGRFDNQCDMLHYWSPHLGGGANFLFADVSVHFLPYAAAPLMSALSTRASGDVASVPE